MIRFTLKEFMTEKNLTIQDVYERTGVSRNTISQFYNGKSKGIQFDTLNKIASGLSASIFDLFTDSINFDTLTYSIKKREKENLKFENIEEYVIPFQVSFFSDLNREHLLFILDVSADYTELGDGIYKELEFVSLTDNVEDYSIQNELFANSFFNDYLESKVEIVMANVINEILPLIDDDITTLDTIVFRTDVGDNTKDSSFSNEYNWPAHIFASKQLVNEYLKNKFKNLF